MLYTICTFPVRRIYSEPFHGLPSLIRTVLAVLALILSPRLIPAADVNTPPPAALTQLPIPEARAFASFFRATVRLDKRAQELEGAGKTSKGLRGGFASTLGLSESAYDTIVSVARKVEQKVAPLDARAKEIIGRVQAEYAGKTRKAGVPPPPAELAQLQNQRDIIVSEGIAELQLMLGDKSFSTLKTYLGKRMGSQARLVKPE